MWVSFLFSLQLYIYHMHREYSILFFFVLKMLSFAFIKCPTYMKTLLYNSNSHNTACDLFSANRIDPCKFIIYSIQMKLKLSSSRFYNSSFFLKKKYRISSKYSTPVAIGCACSERELTEALTYPCTFFIKRWVG